MAKAAIQIEGVKELRSACKATGDKIGIAQLKEAHGKAAEIVRAAATAKMPFGSGALQQSWKAKGLQTGGVVESKLRYAGIHEFGGTVYWKGRKGGYQVDTKGNVYRARNHKLWRKLPVLKPPNSYFVYPAIQTKEQEIVETYVEEIYKVAGRFFTDD
ncbi:MAG: hypothetical protein PHS80_11965 [Methanothrix sp.]|nr:hypothetical protein [Methanothrix sp.]